VAYRSIAKGGRIGPFTTGDHPRAPASKERRQETANSHPAIAGGQRREDARSGPCRREDDVKITALKLPPGTLSPEMDAYFKKCTRSSASFCTSCCRTKKVGRALSDDILRVVLPSPRNEMAEDESEHVVRVGMTAAQVRALYGAPKVLVNSTFKGQPLEYAVFETSAAKSFGRSDETAETKRATCPSNSHVRFHLELLNVQGRSIH